MTTPDQSRLMDARARPRIMELWWALRPLTSVVRFMQSGAHPDDETTAMLAALAVRDGINLSYACSTRGEGGQNDIGTEAGAALGALRTREMERACDVLGMRMYWHSEGPDDPITDFGFSKSGGETLGRWGRDRTLARFVEIVRADRPDILCPTFLDVPGQHGHHRAMTELAHAVIDAAADPAFPSNAAPWTVRKLYLPAWSGAGQAYDDDEPPPEATLRVDGTGRDPVSGWSWARIGQMSRAWHRTQGMGRWPGPDEGAGGWPLHLARTRVEGPDEVFWSGVPRSLGELAQLEDAGAAAGPLAEAAAAVDRAVAAFPDFGAVAEAAARALAAVRAAREACPEALRDEVVHRLDAKEAQLGHVLRHALGAEVRVRTDATFLAPGDTAGVTVEADPGDGGEIGVDFDLPTDWEIDGETLRIGRDAAPTDPYRTVYDPLAPPAPAVVATLPAGDMKAEVRLPFEIEPVVVPARAARVTPDALVLNRAHGGALEVTISDVRPAGAPARLRGPEGWSLSQDEGRIAIRPPEEVTPGLSEFPVEVDGGPAATVRRIAHAHVAPTLSMAPARLRLAVLDAVLPSVRIGYVGAGNDRVGHWLRAIGFDVTDLDDATLARDRPFAGLDTVVVGIFAFRFRAGLARAVPALHDFVEAGGTLVTLYHRPWDNWDPDRVPPRRLEIGQPSLRWRVTDEAAEVRHLVPDHPLLTTPNRIGPEDWAGWVKERGLYFARGWDNAYLPLLEMADPGEAPHRGALLVADIGAGRHVHTSLILHHQMENLVPGAFRLMANFVAARR